jgi:hypothetical protein
MVSYFKDHLASIGVAVVVISFGALEGAEAWLKETKCPFPMFLDLKRSLYRVFGLHRSLLKVCSNNVNYFFPTKKPFFFFVQVFNHKTLRYYGEQKATGRDLPKAVEGVEDDPLQMGGDFTIESSSMKIVMFYPSSNPEDRPTVESIIRKFTP